MSLYVELKNELIKQMLEGKYLRGHSLPTEHELCERYAMSRVTVRKALEELKKEGLVVSVQGQGTVVSGRVGGHPGRPDMIALVAAAHNPFFASFMRDFEQAAEQHGSLVVFKQDFGGEPLGSESFYYRLIKKNIRNVVLWPQTDTIDLALIRRLRSIGMNLVLFDQPYEEEAVDVVCVDHVHAVSSLYASMKADGVERVVFVGYAGTTMPSELLRERAFLVMTEGRGEIYTIPWGGDIEVETMALLERLASEDVVPAGLLCCNGPIGLAALKYRARRGWTDTPIAVIDDLPEFHQYEVTSYRQPMENLAWQVYERLVIQSTQSDEWRASVHLMQGTVARHTYKR